MSFALPPPSTWPPGALADPTLRKLVLEMRRRAIRRSFLAWCTEALASRGEKPAAHHRLLIGELERVARGETDRLMVFMPPGSAKTTYASVLFPPWFISQRSGLDVIGTGYNAELAEDFSGLILGFLRDHAAMLGYGLLGESRKLWRTTNRGMYRAAGAGGGVTGRRSDLFLIDDPIKDRQDADSELIRDTVYNWYRAVVVPRLKPGARVVLIQTRWHEDDLAGRLLAEQPNAWRVINLPAIAGEDDALGRAPGEPLWPEYWGGEFLARKRTEVGEREWAALYQQSPRPLEGSLFKVAKIAVLDVAPSYTPPPPPNDLPSRFGVMSPPAPPIQRPAVVRAWDLAATEQVGTRDPDWTVGLKMMREPTGRYVVLDIVRLRGGPDEVEAAVVNTAAQDGREIAIRLNEDPGQAGKQQSLYYTRRLAGFRVEAVRETGDKATRAGPVASQCNGGNLAMVRAPWNASFRDELAGFPVASHDDQVDALSGAFAALTDRPRPARVTALAL